MGTVNVADGSAQLSVHHAGGWSPLGSGGALADLLQTPAFDGTLAVGVGSGTGAELGSGVGIGVGPGVCAALVPSHK